MQGGFTALRTAAAMGHLEVVQLLLRHRADKELENNNGDKPVDLVCKSGNNEQHKAAITALLR